jgi:hypothetical protein
MQIMTTDKVRERLDYIRAMPEGAPSALLLKIGEVSKLAAEVLDTGWLGVDSIETQALVFGEIARLGRLMRRW